MHALNGTVHCVVLSKDYIGMANCTVHAEVLMYLPHISCQCPVQYQIDFSDTVAHYTAYPSLLLLPCYSMCV